MIVIERIRQRIIHHGIDNGCIVHTISETSLRHRIRSHGHVLHTAGNNDISLSGEDLCSCLVHTLKTGSADHVKRNRRNLDRKTCLDGSLTGNILSLCRLNDTSHKNLVNLLRLNTGTV